MHRCVPSGICGLTFCPLKLQYMASNWQGKRGKNILEVKFRVYCFTRTSRDEHSMSKHCWQIAYKPKHPEMFWLNRFICLKSVIGLFINKTFLKFVRMIQPEIPWGPTIKCGLSVWHSYAHIGNCLYIWHHTWRVQSWVPKEEQLSSC